VIGPFIEWAWILLGWVGALMLCCLGVWVIVEWRRDRREGAALIRGLAGGLVEWLLPWIVLTIQFLYVLETREKLLGFLLPWPVATGVAGGALWAALRKRRRGEISRLLAAGYVLYCLAFWAFYVVPDPTDGLTVAFFLLLARNLIYYWWGPRD